MPLIKKPVQISFQGGIDTKTDPKQTLPGKLLDLQNGIFLQTGGINRRWGYKMLGQAIIGSTALISSCKAIDSGFNNEILLYDGTNAYSYIAADNAWAPRGGMVSIIQTNQQIVRNGAQQLSPDSATLGGIQVYAWEDSRGGIRYTVVDQLSGSIIQADQPLYAGMASTIIRPKCIPCTVANVISIFFVDNAGNISCILISPSNPTKPTGPFPLISGLTTPAVYDVATTANGGVYVYTWQTTGLPPPAFSQQDALLKLDMTVPKVSLATGGLNSSSGAIPLCMPALVPDPNTNNLWAILSSPAVPSVALGTLINGSNLNPITGGLQLVNTTGNVQAITGTVDANSKLTALFEIQNANGNFIQKNTATPASVIGFPSVSAPVFARSVGLASKAFLNGTSAYVNVAFQSQQQSTYFTLDAGGNVVSKAIAQLGGGYVANSDAMLPECQAVNPGVFAYTNLIKGIVNTEAGAVQSLLGVNSTQLDFAHSNSFLSVAINGGFYTVGGILQSYDGAQYVEHGFHVYPEAAVFTPSASGGAMATGTYDYAITYEWVDNLGNTQLSTPSLVSTVAVTGPTGSVQITIPTLRLTKKANVRLVVYRTTGAGGTLGTIFYRVTSALVPLFNSTTVDTLSFTDTLADASITSNGTMYTQPLTVGTNPVLPNAAPPASSLIATFANRLFLAGVDDPFTIWYSQASIIGSPVQFSASLTLRCDPDGGPITAIARMDDKLVIFKKAAIFYITGQGPTATGDQNDFGTPIAVPSGGVGCGSPNSIVLTPIGLLFQSQNGIYLLDRGLNVSYKGAPVEAYTSPLGQNLPITSATLVPNQWVIFTTNTATGLVYDYFYDQWSTFTNHSAVDSDLYVGGGNLFIFANASGQVFEQTPTAYSDNGVPIKFRALTAKINPGVLQGYQRVYHAFLLGAYKGTHNLSVACLFDYDDTATALALIPVDATLGTGVTYGTASPFGIDSPFGGVSSGQTVYQFRLDILRKCQSIQFDITDSQASPGNEGFSLSALTLIVGVKQGAFKVPAVKQFGVS